MSEYLSLRKKVLESRFSRLNDRQKQAVFKVNGPVLILAGAGSGKTTVIINRIANMVLYGNAYHSLRVSTLVSDDDILLLKKAAQNYAELSENEKKDVDMLIAENPVKPWNILAITFTNKAANEIKERLVGFLGDSGNDVNSGTFHSACVRILRRDIEKIGYGKNFTIYDADDSKRVIKECLKELNLDENRFPFKGVLNEISKAKDNLLDIADYAAGANGDYYREKVAKIYELYQSKLKNANALDFDDIIRLTVELFKKCPETLEFYRNRYKYVMVDEYQDTNMSQYELVSLLAGGHKNLCVVGDDDQSIYSFRGATIENILNFEEQFDDTATIRLEQNYRSTKNILDAANAVISNNHSRKSKSLWTSGEDGEKITEYRFDDESAEAKEVAETILDNVSKGGLYCDNAVLYRTNSQSNNFERAFTRSGIPYRIIGGHRFADRMEVKDIISYLCVIDNPNDQLRLERIINQPKRSIGDLSVKNAIEISRTLGQSLFETVCSADQYLPLKRSASSMLSFAKMMQSLIEYKNTCPDLGDLAIKVISESGYDLYLHSLGEEGKTRIDNVQELVNEMTLFSKENPEATLSDYLEEFSLMSEIDNYDSQSDTVVLMTVHSAKGLEFKNVFLAGMEEGVFPSSMNFYDQKEIEEERRLAYVAITRAKKKLSVSSCKSRMLYGQTQHHKVSRFVEEIPSGQKMLVDKTLNDRSSLGSSHSDDFFFSDPHAHTGSFSGFDTHFPKSQFTASPSQNKTQSGAPDYKVGDTVNHRVFGNGLVISMTPMANDTLVEVSFDKVGTKKIMSNFAKLKKV